MSADIKHIGRIDENGKKVYYNPELYRSEIDLLRGHEFVEIIKKKHQKITQSQLGYYYGCILPTCHKTNEFIHCDRKEDIHDDYFAPKFLSYDKIVEFNDIKEKQTKIRKIELLSKDETTDFIQRVLGECANLNIYIPSPEESYNKYFQK